MPDPQILSEREVALASKIQTLQESLAALEKQISRAGREQLKTNSLAEAQTEQLSSALDQLRMADERREAELHALREGQRAEIAAARLEVARRIIPALDGIDAAMRSGQQLREQQQRGAFLRQLLQLQPETSQADIETLQTTLESWLHGLEFVRRRLLDALAAEGITPIVALGQAFDPGLHVAIEIVRSDTLQPGMVAQELRRGYQMATHVLRHAEVAVVTV